MTTERETDIPLDVLVVGSGREEYGPALSRRSLTVERRSNLLKALVLLEARPVRVLVIGYEEIADREDAAFAEVRRHAPDSRVLLLYPPSFAERSVDGPPEGAADTLEEPCLPEVLARRVELLLGLPVARLRFDQFVIQATKASRDTSLLARILVEYAQSVTRAGRVSLLFYRKSRSEFFIAESRGLPDGVQKEAKAGRTVASWLIRTPRPVLVEDIMASEYRPLAEPERYESPSFLSFPLLSNGSVMGILCLSEPGPGRSFSERDLRALVAPVDVAASFIYNARQMRHLRWMSIVDPLTRLYNRRLFDRLLELEVNRAQRASAPVSLVLFDLNDFKAYNDDHGHPAADELLRNVAKLMKNVFRATDICCRFGGDEFGVIMPSAGAEDARPTLERFEARLAELETSVSSGISSSPDDGLSPDTITRAADRALYRAKRRYKVEKAMGAELGSGPDAKGVIVSSVTADGPAEEAGLRAGDEVLEVDGLTAQTPVELFAELFSALKAGDHTFRVRVLRGKRKLTVDLPLLRIR
ncbi:MAG: GGDEF domain-containing protein [Planctomycetota bacterium]